VGEQGIFPKSDTFLRISAFNLAENIHASVQAHFCSQMQHLQDLFALCLPSPSLCPSSSCGPSTSLLPSCASTSLQPLCACRLRAGGTLTPGDAAALADPAALDYAQRQQLLQQSGRVPGSAHTSASDNSSLHLGIRWAWLSVSCRRTGLGYGRT